MLVVELEVKVMVVELVIRFVLKSLWTVGFSRVFEMELLNYAPVLYPVPTPVPTHLNQHLKWVH